MRNVWLVAKKEFSDCLQSRWLASGGLLFAILSLAVFYGTAAIGGSFSYPPLSGCTSPPVFGRARYSAESPAPRTKTVTKKAVHLIL